VSRRRSRPLPTSPRPRSAAREGAFVGRDAELASIAESLERAAQGAPTVAVLAGEPGIGKTRLAAEAAARAEHAGARVLYGRSEEGLGVSGALVGKASGCARAHRASRKDEQ